MQGYLYSKCIDINNIKSAIEEVNNNFNYKANVPGPDGITKYNKLNINDVIKEVKLRLRRFKRINSNIKDQKIILNLFDRYAHQAVYRIISPIIETKMDINSYACRIGISNKLPVSKIANFIKGSTNAFTVEMNFKNYFSSINLNVILQNLKLLGITDTKLLITIKHLMWISKDFNNIGIYPTTILGKLLYNCYFYQLDQFINQQFEINQRGINKSRDYPKYKDNWIEWNNKLGKKICCKYFRYLDNIIILATIKEEQQYIWQKISNFIQTNMNINLSLIDYKLRQNKTDFLGFHIIKDQKSLWIKIQDEQKIYNKIKQFRLINHINLQNFKKYLSYILNYYDIVNDMRKLLNKIMNFLYYQSKNGYIKKAQGTENIIFQTSKGDIINIWKMRKITKNSFKTYLVNAAWIKERELLLNHSLNDEQIILKWILFTKQKGKDKITNQSLNPLKCIISTDKNNNLILVNIEENN